MLRWRLLKWLFSPPCKSYLFRHAGEIALQMESDSTGGSVLKVLVSVLQCTTAMVRLTHCTRNTRLETGHFRTEGPCTGPNDRACGRHAISALVASAVGEL